MLAQQQQQELKKEEAAADATLDFNPTICSTIFDLLSITAN